MRLERVGPYLWRIPPDARPGMRVPGLVVADEALIASIRSDASLEQVANGATLPGIVKASLAMPDILPVGTQAALRETFGSTCHGTGRRLSRTAAVKAARGRRIQQELEAAGVVARATRRDAPAEEMPEAYKDVREVVDVVHRFGISTRVARLKPLGVIKG
ncbi:MAG TPA: RtcB family protein [Methylomirabilota bacterium]